MGSSVSQTAFQRYGHGGYESRQRPDLFQSKSGPAELRGRVARVVFRNPDTGGSILSVEPEDGGHAITVLATTLAGIGEKIIARGTWKTHPQYGPQVKAQSVEIVRPTATSDVQAYLASGALPGIGEAMAKRIVAKFGDDTLKVLEQHPERLREIRGLGGKRAAAAAEAWNAKEGSRKAMMFLAGHGVGPAQCVRIFKAYKERTEELVTADPYRLVHDIRGIGFLKADAIARAVGISSESPRRIEAALENVLDDGVTRGGNCGVPIPVLLQKSVKLLSLGDGLIRPVLGRVLDNGDPWAVLADATASGRDGVPTRVECVFPKWLYTAESSAARELGSRARRAGLWPDAALVELNALIDAASQQCNVQLAPEQRDAVATALTRKVSVLTGGPGTGKTATLDVILHALEMRGCTATLAAPTGKAAKRMQEVTGCDAHTIAKLCGVGDTQGKMIDSDILVVDESSMVDTPMLCRILKYTSDDTSLLFVGDVDQLRSIGPGSVLSDIIESNVARVTRLTHVFRQAAMSAIVRNAHRLNHGDPLEPAAFDGSTPDFVFVEEDDPAAIPDRIVTAVRDAASELQVGTKDIQVLSPMRGTTTGVNALNALMQHTLNGAHSDAYIQVGDTRFTVGDRVIHVVNDYTLHVMNGETGMVLAVDPAKRSLTVGIDDRTVTYTNENLDELNLAYAITIHKAQGSQFPVTVVPVTNQHHILLSRAILYTAITRAVQRCVLIGQKAALAYAIGNRGTSARVTRLRELLVSAAPAPM
ncbi:MAG TPA: ATP-dependent RecD-like DNA helicase [Nevskiaceae bacterium]|nr:ATP-dependent RecD-like DNA helicase [Nevskiaceae bacterium]